MNCPEFERSIYLYSELTSSERKILDDHRSQCDACGQLAHQVFQSQALIKRVSENKPLARDSHRLMQRIMSEVKREKITWLAELVSYVDSHFVRYAFSAVSLFLITFFMYEQQTADYATAMNQVSKPPVKQGPVLDVNLFRSNHLQRTTRKETEVFSRYAYYKTGRIVKTINQ